MSQRGRPRKTEEKKKLTPKELRKFSGRKSKTDFSFLKEMFPKKFGSKVFRLITEDNEGVNEYDYADRGWEPVILTSADASSNPILKRFLRDKESGDGSVVRIPVNKYNNSLGTFGLLMMKDREAFEEEERAALAYEVEQTTEKFKSGQNQSDRGVDGDVLYAPYTDSSQKNRGYQEELKDKLI